MNIVAIVDYRLCNLGSVRRAVEECGGHPVVTESTDVIRSAARIILPGVGAFPQAMEHLRNGGIADVLTRQVIEKGVPFLGICLGMQMMATIGFEGQPTSGLGWIDGEVRRLVPGGDIRVPHIGWNEVIAQPDDRLMAGVPSRSDFYFVHSYAVWPTCQSDVLATTPYGDAAFPSAVHRDNMWGVQFHPEKSQRVGFQVIRNFLHL
jgi:glutamine amidotransferase